MSAFLGRIPTFYRGYRFSGVASTPESAFLQTLSQRPGWRMAVVAEIANVIDGPTLAFLDHQHSSFQLWVPCFRSTRSGILRASRFGMVEALATTALSAGVLLLENGLACSNLLLAGSWRASLSNCARRRSDRGAAPPDPEYDSGSGCRRIFALRRQGRLRRRGRCGCHYLYRPG